MTRCNVLHIVDSLEFGGAEKVVVDLANQMSTESSVGVCCVRKYGELASQLQNTVQRYCLNKGDGNEYSLWLRLRSMFKQHDVRVVHLHNWGNYLDVAIACLTLPHITLVATIHGPYGEYPPGIFSSLKRRLRHLLEITLSTRFDRIYAVAHSIASELTRRHLPRQKIAVIHNGISICSPTNPASFNDSLPGANHKPLLITVARLAPIKNQRMLLEAFRAIADEIADARLWIIGDGPDRQELEKFAQELAITDKVWFAGFRADATDLLAHCHGFLLTSHHEGISISLLEAMRAGLPCFATAVGGIPETIIDNDTGYLIPANDPAILATKVISAWKQPEHLTAMGQRAQTRQKAAFSIESMHEKYLVAYGLSTQA